MHTAKPKKNKNPHDGSTLDDFLKEEGIFEEVEAAALKSVMAMRIADLMEEKEMKKTNPGQTDANFPRGTQSAARSVEYVGHADDSDARRGSARPAGES